MNLVDLAPSPVRVSVAGASVAQDLRLAVDVSDYTILDLELTLLDDGGGGTAPLIRLLTGMRRDSEDGWVEVDSFVASSAPATLKKSFFPLLRYARWEVTAGSPTFVLRGVGHRGRPFVPTDVRGCILWLRSDRGVTVSSGNVSSWSDKSGSGNDATQGTSADQPAYQASGWSNGLPTIEFDRSNTEWMSISGMSDSSDDYSLFCALDQRSATTGPQDVLSSNSTSTRIFCAIISGSDYVGIFDGTAWRATGASENGEQYLSWLLDSAGGSVECFRNGSSIGTATYAGDWQQWANVKISSHPTHPTYPHHLDAGVGEIILYDRKLSDEELARVHRYLSARYDV